MGRRRKKYRKRLLLRPQRRLPTIFDCPNCGARMLSVSINKKKRNEEGLVLAVVSCGKCGLRAEMWVPEIYEPVDVYSKFLDGFLAGTIEYKIEGGGEAEVSLSELAEGEGEGGGVEAGEG